MKEIRERVKEYWTKRAYDFGTVRRMELQDDISNRWLYEINKYIPKEKKLDILDVGTGTGYFSFLLEEQGHQVCGVDLTPSMIEEAKKLASERQSSSRFLVMDAQNLDFADESFDVVVARNLTWTLPEPECAYKEWMRVLKKGGILLNFDADYGQGVLNHKDHDIASSGYHIGLTKELREESDQITKSMNISKNKRPDWDIAVIVKMGYAKYHCDPEAGTRILRERNSQASPTFLLTVQK